MKTPKALSNRMAQIVRQIDSVDANNQRDEETITACQEAIRERIASVATLRIELSALQFAVSSFSEPEMATADVEYKDKSVADQIVDILQAANGPMSAKQLSGHFPDNVAVSPRLSQLAQRGIVVHKGIGLWGLP